MSSPYIQAKTYDIGEINETNHNILRAHYRRDVSTLTQFRTFFREHFGYDQFPDHRGPFKAVVLKVLAGPQAYNDARTSGHGLTKCLRIKGLDDVDTELAVKGGAGNSLVRIIAKVPEFDVDIDWPNAETDLGRISAHGEFQAVVQDTKLTNIRPGHIVFIRFTSEYWTSNLSGRPAGILMGPGPGGPTTFEGLIKEITRAKYEPKCKISRELIGPSGPLYAGNTVSEVQPGPPIRRLKGRIKTGIYGDGTQNTKTHFIEALAQSPESFKHKIPGPAPGPNNAFIWVGHLKNNGYMDLIDRPHTPGRETIIYASKMLDLSSPIEIKYYFHDDGGFGHAWLKGPITTPSEAKQLAITSGNDFREKIAPGIKDLIKEKRNLVLVIPEMMYSKGFGTGQFAAQRMKKIAERTPPYTEGEKAPGLTVRTKPTENTIPYIKEYLASLPATDDESLLNVSRLRDREFSTFDGSFTGGNFHLFHQEVLDVLQQYLGIKYDSVEFISILADGLGAVNLSAMAKSVPSSATHTEAENAFKLVNIQKIDFINTGFDRDITGGPASLQMGGAASTSTGGFILFPSTPSYSLYEDYLTYKAENPAQKMEFNYITYYASDEPKTNKFFDVIGHGDKYRQHYKSNPSPERKFTIFTNDVDNSKSTISLHITSPGDQVAYAFSMINDFTSTSINYPLKSVNNPASMPSIDAIPNHAEAVNAKTGPAGLEQILREMIQVEEQIKKFEDVLAVPSDEGDGDWGNLCSDDYPQYKAYCKEGFFYNASDGPFARAYSKYFEDKRRYMELQQLQFFEQQMEYLTTKESVQQQLTEYEVILNTHTSYLNDKSGGDGRSVKDIWNEHKKSFRAEYFSTKEAFDNMVGDVNDVTKGYIADIADTIARRDAVEKYINKLIAKRNLFKTAANPEVPIDCATEPVLLKDMFLANKKKIKGIKSTAVTPAVSKCGDIDVKLPKNYTDLAKMIPYFPVRDDFQPFKKKGGKFESGKTTTLIELDGFKTGKFQYRSRVESPDGRKYRNIRSRPLWSCLAARLEDPWKAACDQSRYIPFRIHNGIRGYGVNSGAATAYNSGVSNHALGLAFDMDACLTGYATEGARHSVFTGAWTPGIGDNPLLGPISNLFPEALGVFRNDIIENSFNIYASGDSSKGPLLVGNRFAATDHYEKGEGYASTRSTLSKAEDTPIVPPDSNPTLWVIRFCELSGMRWGNGHFLKRRWTGTAWVRYDFTQHSVQLDEIYGIPNVVQRVKNISWQSRRDDHMHFQFWKRGSILAWPDILAAKKKLSGG